MLQLKLITKTYKTGELTQDALKSVSINFRENEFVSILGQSGSGKTTMLNIIGGLDRYTHGDLLINGVSTRMYKDRDWDYYRNNSIGFVFQNYNLIPHQTVLANVELSLTLTGVSKKERRKRAKEVLEKVGLKDHMHKKPNQMSGGQMQRVAIARALINNPDILLADEPTGALDSETSVQIMELLKEIAKDKLVIMVTHNPELAAEYSTRIVKLLDGKIVSDSNPFEIEEINPKVKKNKKVSMSFLTALSLSFNNLRTKKARTLLTSFAGSIGIIGIALILALSTGLNAYITNVQKDTMTSYPINISAKTFDLASMMGKMQGKVIGEIEEISNKKIEEKVYADYTQLEASEMLTSSVVENNLTEFKKYLDNPDSEINQYLGENGIIYNYDTNFSVYSYNKDGELIDSDIVVDETMEDVSVNNSPVFTDPAMLYETSDNAKNFTELMVGKNGKTVSQVTTDSYDVVYGNWPEKYNEVVLVLNKNNGITAESLYQLGLITKKDYDKASKRIEKGKDAQEITFDYKNISKHKFYLVMACDHYTKKNDSTFSLIEDIGLNEDKILKNAIELKISGIIRPKKDAKNADILTPVAYNYKLTDLIIEKTDESEIITAQEKNKNVNVLNGMRFEAKSKKAKIEDAKEYLSSLGVSEKASFYQLFMYSSQGENNISSIQGMMFMDENSMAAALDYWLETNPDEEVLLKLYDEYIAGATYEDNMKAFGKVSYNAPSTISIYADTFENKDFISECIENYNNSVEEDNRITYTDYVSLMTSSLTTIINSISYLLIAFVGISLIVSCIMIGIITHISVMERTKEIGILRAMGASKGNISQVFNAETFIIGCCAGVIGIGVSLLLMIPINGLLEALTGIENLKAQLPLGYSFVLILISIVITIIGGLLPAKKAAKKDPVIALRTE